MTRAEEAIQRARALVGTRFIAQGRDPALGVDCVGLVLLAYRIDPSDMPDDYRLGGPHRAAILRFSAACFRRVARTQMRAGDVLLFRTGRSQWHLGLWTGDAVIHADVARRMTVKRPGMPEWPVAAVLRPRTRISKGR